MCCDPLPGDPLPAAPLGVVLEERASGVLLDLLSAPVEVPDIEHPQSASTQQRRDLRHQVPLRLPIGGGDRAGVEARDIIERSG